MQNAKVAGPLVKDVLAVAAADGRVAKESIEREMMTDVKDVEGDGKGYTCYNGVFKYVRMHC